MSKPLQDEIDKALFGRRRGGRIRVKEDPAKRTADGIVFHSGHEMGVYLQFKSLLNAGTFKDLRRQVPFPIYVIAPDGHKVKIFDWLADFVVVDREGRESVFDAKGWATDIYKIKKKAVEAQYGIRILEV